MDKRGLEFYLTETLKQIYAPYFDADYIHENLLIPNAFLQSIGKLNQKELFDQASIVAVTGSGIDLFGDDFLERKLENKLSGNDVLYICIGEWGSRHEFLLCCDRSSQEYGNVFDYNDAHPWCDGNEAEVNWTNFEEFLKDEYKIEL